MTVDIDHPIPLMDTGNPLTEDIQSSSVGEMIWLFDLDLRPIDPTLNAANGVFHFTLHNHTATPVTWKGPQYTPIDIDAEGFEVNGKGQLPRPTLKVGNVNLALLSPVITYEDMLGATVTRWRTLRKYLAGQSHENNEAYYPPDIFRVERKTSHTPVEIVFELSSMIDAEGRKLPRRQMLRDTCTYVYRNYNAATGEFIYATKGSICPYAKEFDYATNAITGATKASPCVLTVTGHGCVTGNPIYVDNAVGGMTQIRGKVFVVTVVDANHLALNGVNSTSYGTYTSSGTIKRQPSYFDRDDTLTTKANDHCGQRLESCKLRYPGKVTLPMFAFLGMTRVRTS
jgi:lambda family phage minor tail protein L